jgi:uncharacterized protein
MGRGVRSSRVLIELSLLTSPWAYSVLAITIAIDLYLLYVFFSGGRAPAKPQPPNPVPSHSHGATDCQDRNAAEGVREFRGDLTSTLETFLGYVIAMSAIAMLIYTALGKF